MKIFCIGFHKTGTKSLASALTELGFRVTGPNGVYDPDIAESVHSMVEPLVKEYDAFQDNPWPILYKELDKKYPGSKFILTQRRSDSWLKSVVRHFGRDITPMREWIYGVGCPEGNEDIYVHRYEKHNEEVIEHFRERPNDFLILNIVQGDGWDKLCPFLGKGILYEEFPFINRASDREMKLSRKRRTKP